jgi:uncharacterized protein YeaC (DUF1315 family)
MARISFAIDPDFYDDLIELTAEQRGNVLDALIAWAQDDTPVELDPVCKLLFGIMVNATERRSKKRHKEM